MVQTLKNNLSFMLALGIILGAVALGALRQQWATSGGPLVLFEERRSSDEPLADSVGLIAPDTDLASLDEDAEIEDAANGKRTPFDAVVMDIRMPRLDGLSAARRIRTVQTTVGIAPTPLIALTANAMKGFEKELDAAGFSGFQTKPIDVDALLADLAARLDGRSVASAPAAAQTAVAAPTVTEPAAAAISTPVATAAEPALVSRLAGHAKLGPIVMRFVEQLPARLEQMQTALQGSDWSELAAQAHWLKGAGGSMGFDDLFEPARALEDAAKAADAGAATDVMAQLQRLRIRIEHGAATGAPMEVTTP